MNARLTARGHVHGEAFCLMKYRCNGKHIPGAKHVPGSGGFPRSLGCGHTEIIWNSRDGVTPFGIGCPSCGGDLMHIDFRGDLYAPDHKPHRGQGIWRDGTPDEAERYMRERIDKCKGTPYEVSPEYAEQLVAVVRSEGPENTEFQKGWPMFYRHGGEA